MICWGLGGFGLGVTGVSDVNTKEDLGAHAEIDADLSGISPTNRGRRCFSR